MVKKHPRRYRFDLIWRSVRRKIKKLTTSSIFASFKPIREKNNLANDFNLLLNQESVPWLSPNIWIEVEKFYINISEPIVFEFGTGASSLSHVNNLLKLNGTYIGVESDPHWFWTVTCALMRKLSDCEKNFTINVEENDGEPSNYVDITISSQRIKIFLKLRESKLDYINALDDPCDVVIVDGVYRKDCIKRVLNTDYLKIDGLVVLMEAGRGSPEWWEGKLTDEKDYTEELNEMLRLGGRLLDGDGVDNWPFTKKRSPVPISYFYPMEACLLIRPDSDNNKGGNI